MIEVEYKGAAYREGDDGWVRDMVQEITTGIMLSESKLNKISELVRSSIEGNVYNQREYLGGAAAADAPLTIKKKGHGIVFYDDGLLRHSISEREVSRYEREVFVAPERSVIATMLQYGTERMPARPFFGVSNEILEKIKQIILTN